MALTCVRCGAPLEARAETCPYCGTMTAYGESQIDTKREEELAQKQDAARRQEFKHLPAVKHVSILSALLIYIFTLGSYGNFWYLLRASSLNKLKSDAKLPLIFPVIQVSAWLLICVCTFSSIFEDMGLEEYSSSIFNWSLLVLFVMSLVQAFRVQKILRIHTNQLTYFDPDRRNLYKRIAPSSLLLFLIGPVYLQYTINKMCKKELLRPAV